MDLNDSKIMCEFISKIKNPGLAAVLSFLIPGLGQLYNGQFGKTIGVFVLGVIIAVIVVAGMTNDSPIVILIYPIFVALAIMDAYNSAQDINIHLLDEL